MTETVIMTVQTCDLNEMRCSMDYNEAALALHRKFPGKIAVQSLVPCRDKDALSDRKSVV